MYMVVAGKHPLYRSGDKTAKYIAQIKDPQWNFPETFSVLAKDLFLKLVKVDPLERYTAKEALGHPWITRVPGSVPLSYSESVRHEHSKEKLITVAIYVMQ